MTVNIHGKEYVTVAERVKMLHDSRDSSGARFDISTDIVADTEDAITVKAYVECAAGRFTAHATSKKKASGIEGGSPLEVAETSAVGRALGFAGFGSAEGIASADEVQRAQPRRQRKTHAELETEAKEIAAKPWACSRCGTGVLLPAEGKNCPKCGHVRGAKPTSEPEPEPDEFE